MNDVWTIFALGGLLGTVSTGFLAGIIAAIVAIIRRLKPWVHLPDEEGGMGFHGRAKFKDGHILIGKGEDQKRYPVNVSSRSVTNGGIVYTLGRQTGANLRVPRTTAIKAALKDDAGAVLMFDVADPGLLGRTYARRMAQETVDSQTEKEDWKRTAILPVTIVAGLALLGLIITVITLGA